MCSADTADGALRVDAKQSQPENLAHTATRGAAIILAGRAARIICQFAGVVIIAHYLSPTEYGLVAMAGAFVGVASMLGDFGLSLSSLRSVTMSPAERGALFWFSTALGAFLAIIMTAAAPLLAHFYHQPEVTLIVIALSPLFIINGASSQYRADAIKRGMYTWTAAADLISAVVGLIIGIVAAVAGASYWTLILQNWIFSLISMILIVVACGWSPGWPSWNSRLRGHLSFGGYSTITQAANYGSSNVVSVALGRFLGPEAVGTFSRAYQLFNLPVDQLTAPLTSIILPLLAKVDPERLPDVLRRVQRCLVYVVLGICLVIAVGGTPLVTVVLGERWARAGDIVQLLMVGAIFQLSGYIYYWAFLTTGRPKLLFWCDVPARVIMTALIALGAWHGEMGAAIGHSAGLAASWFFCGFFGVRALGWRVAPLMFGSAYPVALYLWAFAVGAFSRSVLLDSGVAPIWCLLISIGAAAVAVGSSLVFPVYRAHARELLDLSFALVHRTLPGSFTDTSESPSDFDRA
jgi:O-antigen/teichoic acid export membrane protein